MKITINNKAYEVDGSQSILQILGSLQLPTTGIAVAVNGHVVKANLLSSTTVNDGDSLMVIKAFYGG